MTAEERKDFVASLTAMMEGAAHDLDYRILEAAMREEPDCVDSYSDQLETHLLLSFAAQQERQRRRTLWRRRIALAAGLLLAVGLAGVLPAFLPKAQPAVVSSSRRQIPRAPLARPGEAVLPHWLDTQARTASVPNGWKPEKPAAVAGRVLESGAANPPPQSILPPVGNDPTAWFRPFKDASWGNAGNWFAGTSSLIERIPGEQDTVTHNSSFSPPSAPLLVDSAATCGRFMAANMDKPYWVALRVLPGGTLVCRNGGEENNAGFLIGGQGHGWFTVDNGGTVQAVNGMIAYDKGSSALVTNRGEMAFSASLQVGGAGAATFVNEGSLSLEDSVVVGRYPGGRATLAHMAGKLSARYWILAGRGGNGTFVANAPFAADFFCVGSTRGGEGTATLGSQAVGTIYGNCYIGGRVCPLTNEFGSGTLALKGGTLYFPTATFDKPCFWIRTFSEASGVLRGWGRVKGGRLNTVCMVNNGQVIADGEGIPRDLDLHEVVYSTNTVTRGKIGWRAVDGGRLLFPRTWVRPVTNAETAVCLGDYPEKSVPELCNSLRAVFIGLPARPQGVFLNGELYATDREDIPPGLPNVPIAGVWRLGINSKNGSGAPVAFKTVRLLFRFDREAAGFGRSAALYHYTADGWERLGRAGAECTVQTPSDACASGPSIDSANIGWFAVVAEAGRGFVISLQ